MARSLNASVGPVKQLEDEIAHAELHQRGNRGMAEIAVGLARHAGKVVFGNGVTDERADDLDGDFRIGPAGKARDRVRIELRPSRGNVEAAVARKPCQRRLDEAERRGLTPGGDIAHGPGLRFEATRPPCAGHRSAQRIDHITY